MAFITHNYSEDLTGWWQSPVMWLQGYSMGSWMCVFRVNKELFNALLYHLTSTIHKQLNKTQGWILKLGLGNEWHKTHFTRFQKSETADVWKMCSVHLLLTVTATPTKSCLWVFLWMLRSSTAEGKLRDNYTKVITSIQEVTFVSVSWSFFLVIFAQFYERTFVNLILSKYKAFTKQAPVPPSKPACHCHSLSETHIQFAPVATTDPFPQAPLARQAWGRSRMAGLWLYSGGAQPHPGLVSKQASD